MTKSLSLMDAEWDLVVELLRREVDELRTEIRRTDAADFRDELRGRRQAADDLLAKLGPAIAHPR